MGSRWHITEVVLRTVWGGDIGSNDLEGVKEFVQLSLFWKEPAGRTGSEPSGWGIARKPGDLSWAAKGASCRWWGQRGEGGPNPESFVERAQGPGLLKTGAFIPIGLSQWLIILHVTLKSVPVNMIQYMATLSLAIMGLWLLSEWNWAWPEGWVGRRRGLERGIQEENRTCAKTVQWERRTRSIWVLRSHSGCNMRDGWDGMGPA